jgi:hypothetical protein
MTEINIPKQLADASWSKTIDGLRVWELNEDAELLITVGHVDKVQFARACDAYAEQQWGDGLAKHHERGFAELAEDVTHRWAQIIDPPKDKYFDFEIEFTKDGCGFPVTVWAA